MNRKKIFACARYFFTLACLVGTAVPGRSQTSSLDIRALFRIEEEFTSRLTSPPVLLNQSSTFVSRGGYVFLQLSILSADGRLSGGAGRAFANSTQRTVLRDILKRDQIGRQRDCVFLGTGLKGQSQITWYGRSGRRNAFRYVYAEDLSSGLPACSEQALDLLEGLTTIAAVIVDQGGEFFVTPSGS